MKDRRPPLGQVLEKVRFSDPTPSLDEHQLAGATIVGPVPSNALNVAPISSSLTALRYLGHAVARFFQVPLRFLPLRAHRAGIAI
jgi:hypothetical protein